ncbi:MAG: 50S ribosomal protein L24 [Patescibacteria group bacterium]
MKIKTNDKVKILKGKDRGKTGKVLQVFVSLDKVVVEGLNLAVKHQKPKRQGEKGQRIQFPSPVHASSVSLICPKCGKETRVGYRFNKSEGKKSVKTRICKKCNETIE